MAELENNFEEPLPGQEPLKTEIQALESSEEKVVEQNGPRRNDQSCHNLGTSPYRIAAPSDNVGDSRNDHSRRIDSRSPATFWNPLRLFGGQEVESIDTCENKPPQTANTLPVVRKQRHSLKSRFAEWIDVLGNEIMPCPTSPDSTQEGRATTEASSRSDLSCSTPMCEMALSNPVGSMGIDRSMPPDEEVSQTVFEFPGPTFPSYAEAQIIAGSGVRLCQGPSGARFPKGSFDMMSLGKITSTLVMSARMPDEPDALELLVGGSSLILPATNIVKMRAWSPPPDLKDSVHLDEGKEDQRHETFGHALEEAYDTLGIFGYRVDAAQTYMSERIHVALSKKTHDEQQKALKKLHSMGLRGLCHNVNTMLDSSSCASAGSSSGSRTPKTQSPIRHASISGIGLLPSEYEPDTPILPPVRDSVRSKRVSFAPANQAKKGSIRARSPFPRRLAHGEWARAGPYRRLSSYDEDLSPYRTEPLNSSLADSELAFSLSEESQVKYGLKEAIEADVGPLDLVKSSSTQASNQREIVDSTTQHPATPRSIPAIAPGGHGSSKVTVLQAPESLHALASISDVEEERNVPRHDSVSTSSSHHKHSPKQPDPIEPSISPDSRQSSVSSASSRGSSSAQSSPISFGLDGASKEWKPRLSKSPASVGFNPDKIFKSGSMRSFEQLKQSLQMTPISKQGETVDQAIKRVSSLRRPQRPKLADLVEMETLHAPAEPTGEGARPRPPTNRPKLLTNAGHSEYKNDSSDENISPLTSEYSSASPLLSSPTTSSSSESDTCENTYSFGETKMASPSTPTSSTSSPSSVSSNTPDSRSRHRRSNAVVLRGIEAVESKPHL